MNCLRLIDPDLCSFMLRLVRCLSAVLKSIPGAFGFESGGMFNPNASSSVLQASYCSMGASGRVLTRLCYFFGVKAVLTYRATFQKLLSIYLMKLFWNLRWIVRIRGS